MSRIDLKVHQNDYSFQIVSIIQKGGNMEQSPVSAFYVHTDAERKYAAKAARVQRASREDESSLLDWHYGLSYKNESLLMLRVCILRLPA